MSICAAVEFQTDRSAAKREKWNQKRLKGAGLQEDKAT